MRHTPGLLLLALLQACSNGSDPTAANLKDPCPDPASDVLVDATHDGGVWWFPQFGSYFADSTHQGRALAELLRGKGYTVDELPRDGLITEDRLLRYRVVIRAGSYGEYFTNELSSYDAFTACPRTLLLLGEFLRDNEFDGLANHLGLFTSGTFTGTVASFAASPITDSVSALPYIAGSAIDTLHSVKVHVLGWLDTGEPVMALQESHKGKIFFIGDVNGLETLPQPLVDNLVSWGF